MDRQLKKYKNSISRLKIGTKGTFERFPVGASHNSKFLRRTEGLNTVYSLCEKNVNGIIIVAVV